MKKKITLEKFRLSFLKSTEYLSWLENLNNIKTIGRQDLFLLIKKNKIRNYVRNIIESENDYFYLIRNEKKIPVGTIKLSHIDWYSRNGEIGIMIDENYRGNSYASMAIKQVCDLSFSKIGLHKLTAGFMNTNIPMKKAFLKNKFKIEGLKKKHLYALSKYHDMLIVGLINPNYR
jgi:[ribosomal protein S5]-alanine N-acetyltransferase